MLLVIAHDRRRVLHCNVTAHPTAAWVIQQLREAFPFEPRARFLLLDRDAIFSAEVHDALRRIGVQPLRTAYHSPWQNGVAERWIGTCRRELLDHVIVLNEYTGGVYTVHCGLRRINTRSAAVAEARARGSAAPRPGRSSAS